MRRAYLITILCFAWLPGAFGQDKGKLILDENAYWRYCVQFGIDILNREAVDRDGETALGKRGMKALENKVKNWKKILGRDNEDWKENAPMVTYLLQGTSR
jgi:hypothetical protein